MKVRLECSYHFEWGDAFQPTKKVGQYSLYYELGSVMFNYAALYSLAGLNTKRTSEDFAKVGCKYYQQAAGIFGELKKSICPKMRGATTSDFSPEGLQMIIDLMLAQAQALYYNKCHETAAAKLTRGNETMKSALCAKLAAHTVNLYEKSLKVAETSSLASVLHAGWIKRMKYQLHLYKSAAFYKQSEVVHSKALKVGEGYGLELAYLKMAEKQCRLAKEVVKTKGAKFSQVEIGTVDDLLKKISEMFKSRSSDNEVIYLESIPDDSEVPAIVPKAMAKATLPEDFDVSMIQGNNRTFEDLFRAMIPTVVVKSTKRYEKRLSDLLTNIDTTCCQKNHEAREFLASIGLPAAIEATVQSVGLPDSVWAKVEEIKNSGGVDALESILTQNQTTGMNVRARLDEVEATLKKEEEEDVMRRSNSNGVANASELWADLPESKVANSDLRADVGRNIGFLNDARASDQIMRKLLDENRHILQLLTKSRQELASKLPPMTQTTVSAAVPLRKVLIDVLGKLNELIGSRNTLLEKLKLDIASDNIAAKLMEAGCGTRSELHNEWTEAHEMSLFEHEETKYEANKAKLEENFQMQQKILTKIKDLNSKFQGVKTNDENTKHREKIIQFINRAVDRYIDIKEKVFQGQSFYRDIERHTGELLQTTKDYCHGRKLLVEDIAMQQEDNRRAKMQVAADHEFAMNLERSRLQAEQEAQKRQQQADSDIEFAKRLQRMGSHDLNDGYYGSDNAASTLPPPSYDAPPSYTAPSLSNNFNTDRKNVKPKATILQSAERPPIPPPTNEGTLNRAENTVYANTPPAYDASPALSSYEYGGLRGVNVGADSNSLSNQMLLINLRSAYQNTNFSPPPTYDGGGIGHTSSSVEDERLKELSKFDGANGTY